MAEPLIRLDLLRIRNVLVANLVGLVSGVVMFLLFFAIIYYAELPAPFGLALGIVATGLTLAPATLAMLVAGPFAGRAVARFGPRPMLFLACLSMGTGLALFIVNRATSIDLSIDLVFSLVGIVCVIIPIVNMISALAAAGDHRRGPGVQHDAQEPRRGDRACGRDSDNGELHLAADGGGQRPHGPVAASFRTRPPSTSSSASASS